jgi:predicted sulfurtransferase
MQPPRPASSPDTVSFTCTCGDPDGLVLLFYRYFARAPELSPPSSSDLNALVDFHREQTHLHGLTGKIRIAPEGFNVTVAGRRAAIDAYTAACVAHWSFAGLALRELAESKRFFKPSPGCACVFRSTFVRLCAEATPLAITDYAPSAASWARVHDLEPAAWHRVAATARGPRAGAQTVLLDMRNAYESRVGYFVGADGDAAVRPLIRRFGQFPQWVRRRWDVDVGAGLAAGLDETSQQRAPVGLLTYCTGGIRCEKASRWLLEQHDAAAAASPEICTLRGGIHAYLAWVADEVEAGRMQPGDSLFRGRNYVFNARGSLGLPGPPVTDDVEARNLVARCCACDGPCARLATCRGPGCRLVLVVCEACAAASDVVCCDDCERVNGRAGSEDGTRMCLCERTREALLWTGTTVSGRV